MSRFVDWKIEDIEPEFTKAGFKKVNLLGTGEIVFERETKKPKVFIRVFTAISKNTGGSRESGSDAGRVMLFERDSNKPIWSSKRVHRTQGFLERLIERARDAYRAVSNLPRCPVCDGYMVERSKKGLHKPSFLGCLKFPACKGTRKLKG